MDLTKIDKNLLLFFGFDESEIKDIKEIDHLDYLYRLMVEPRKRFNATYLTKAQPSVINSIYQLLSKTLDTKKLYEAVKSADPQKGKDLLKSILDSTSLFGNGKFDTKRQVQALLPVIKNSELVGDLILASIVNDLKKDISKSEKMKGANYTDYSSCISKLSTLLNTNLFLFHILKSINFKIYNFFPDEHKKAEIRIAKRQEIKRNEQFDIQCIDYKYTSNLFEQMIAFTFIVKGYDYIKNIFYQMLDFINFDPIDFMSECLNQNLPYKKLKLQPGCSCIDRNTKKGVCDNPGPFLPKIFYNKECPSKCKSGKEFNLVSLMEMSEKNLALILDQLTDDDLYILIDEILSIPDLEKLIIVFESNLIPALKYVVEKNGSIDTKRFYEILFIIYSQFRLIMEDNFDQDFIALLELFEISEKKNYIGGMIAVYYILRSEKSISSQSKKNMKQKIERYIKNLID
jgi:hypothetical protein